VDDLALGRRAVSSDRGLCALASLLLIWDASVSLCSCEPMLDTSSSIFPGHLCVL